MIPPTPTRTLDPAAIPSDVQARFWGHVHRSGLTECWIWRASSNGNGYGQFWLADETGSDRHLHPAHRIAFALYNNVVLDADSAEALDHLCRNKICVNPRHLEPVTHFENWRRWRDSPEFNSRKTHCKRGHEFTAENTYPRSGGRRECRECMRMYGRQRRRILPVEVKV